MVLLLILGGVFLLGFSEAVGVAIPLVAVFLGLNAVIIGVGAGRGGHHPGRAGRLDRRARPPAAAGSAASLGPAVLAFPLLVLGLSGFETGVSMMPLVAADGATAEQRLRSRIRNTRKLLTTAARHHERLPAGGQLRHHRADPRRGVRSPAARPTAGPWPGWPTSSSARRSAPSTTSAPS